MQNLIPIFLTGLVTGGLTCLAVQGGLLASTIAQREEEKIKEQTKKSGSAIPILSFLVTKLIAYTILGFFLGLFGSFFQLSVAAKTILQFAVVVFMFGTAMNLLEVHPIFRYFAIQPPKFLTRLVRNQSKSKDLFAPAILGAFTIFIPCGITQAMMVLSIGSGNPWAGASILFAFILGTSPIFFILGYFATKLGSIFQKSFAKVAAVTLILLALYNLDGAIALTGSKFTISNAFSKTVCFFTLCDYKPNTNNTALQVDQNPVINIEAYRYNPDTINVKANSNVSLKITNTSGKGCIQAFTIPSLGVQKVIPVGSSETVTFTAPDKPQQLAFMCSMGMFRGVINVL